MESSIYLLLFLTFLFCVYVKRKFDYWKIRDIPYIKPEVSFELIFGKISLAEHNQNIYRKLKDLGRYGGGYFVLNLPIFQPTSLELIKSILIKDYQSFRSRGFYHTDSDPLSQHLVSLDGLRWKKSRRAISSTLTSSKLKQFLPKLIESTQELMETIDQRSWIDCGDFISRWVADNIISCIYGLDRECLKNPGSQLYASGKRVSHHIFGELTYNFIAIVFSDIFQYFNIPLTGRSDRKFLLDYLKNVVDRRLENYVKSNDFRNDYVKSNDFRKDYVKSNDFRNDHVKSNDFRKDYVKSNDFRNDHVKSSDFINDYVQAVIHQDEDRCSFDEFASMIFTFFIAGFTSTYTIMTYLLYELSLNPNIQETLRSQIKNLKHPLDYNTIVNFTYLDQVVNETLRKYPATPFLIRECNDLYQIPGTDQFLSEGTVCWISILAVHRDPEYYPEPDKFDPERFSEVSKTQRHPFCFIPFGDGPRNCIGQRFSLLQIKLGIIQLLSKFSFSLDSRTKHPLQYSSYSILLVPKNKIFLKVTKINHT